VGADPLCKLDVGGAAMTFDPTQNRVNKPKIENRGAHNYVVTCDGFPKSGYSNIQDAAEHFAALVAKPAPRPAIICNGEKVPEPVREALRDGTDYWVPSPCFNDFVLFSYWSSDQVDHARLKRGLIHLTEADAVSHAKAMVKAGCV